jgi:hypothetical protein
MVAAAYRSATILRRDGHVSGPVFVMAADRRGSMLFDADPESSIHFVSDARYGQLCIQSISLARVKFDAPPENILAQVTGRWSGAIYLRAFETPSKKPYLFLGQHRVLIQRESQLARCLVEFNALGRKVQLAETIADLREDDEGYTPVSVRDLI